MNMFIYIISKAQDIVKLSCARAEYCHSFMKMFSLTGKDGTFSVIPSSGITFPLFGGRLGVLLLNPASNKPENAEIYL